METTRTEAFSDGVLAIAITLLILEVKVPHVGEGRLASALWHQWPSYAAYLVSFAIIGIIWVNHHALLKRVKVVDRPFLFLNLATLLAVAFLPFPTALLSDYLREGGANSHVAAAVYSATMTAIGLAFAGLWWYLARQPHLLADGFGADDARRAGRRSALGPLLYGLSIVLAFVSAPACLAVYAALAVYFTFPGGY